MRKVTMISGEQAIPASKPSEPAFSDREVSSSRARVLDVVPVGWLDRLLVSALELPLTSGEEAVTEAWIDAVAAIIPSCAIGACLVSGAGLRSDQRVVRRLPEGLFERPAGTDPTRIFPSLRHEHVVPVPGLPGSTMHIASDELELDPDVSPAVQLINRAAMVLGRSLPNARSVAALARMKNSTLEFEQRMIHADKLATFGQVAAGVVHELNNPLTSIVAYSDYLIRKAIEHGGREADDVERLRRISESANRMLRFTRDLVSYARPSSGVTAPVAVHSVIDRAVAFCEHVLSASGMRVERVYSPEVLTIRAVSEQLVQVFVNLITNACQAAPAADGRILLTTRLADRDATDMTAARRGVVLLVEDNGAGIAPEHLSHVFAPFFTTKGDRHGTGLGLSIVKSIIQSHDGEIRVESLPGRGTRFIIELP